MFYGVCRADLSQKLTALVHRNIGRRKSVIRAEPTRKIFLKIGTKANTVSALPHSPKQVYYF